MTLPQTYTVADVANALQKSPWWVRDQVKKGRVTPLRLGDAFNSHLRFTDEHVAQLMRSLQPAEPVQDLRRRRRRRNVAS